MVAAFVADAEMGWHECHPEEVKEFVHVRDSERIEAYSCGEALGIDEAEVVGLPNFVAVAVAVAAAVVDSCRVERMRHSQMVVVAAEGLTARGRDSMRPTAGTLGVEE